VILSKNRFIPFGIILQRIAEKPSAVIPGRREAASPESRNAGDPNVLDSGLAPSARPGMTSWSFSAAC
jgi:hypothetical protein